MIGKFRGAGRRADGSDGKVYFRSCSVRLSGKALLKAVGEHRVADATQLYKQEMGVQSGVPSM